MQNNRVSLPVIKRLPKYYRYIASMQKSGITTVSSSKLASMMGTTASQVRQDFNCFGGFGQQGIGYSVDVLCAELEKLLFSGTSLDTILIGTGRLGRAVSHFIANEAQGYRLIGAFDQSPTEIGQPLCGLSILDIKDIQKWSRQHRPQVAVLCVPEDSARQLTPLLLELGIKGFWNFSHYDLTASQPDVVVENVHLGDSLTSLGYRVHTLND